MKITYLLIALLIISNSSQAQIIREYGFKAGSTISNQEWEYSTSSGISELSFDTDNKIGFNIGFFAEFLDLPLISIVTEINCIQQGMKKELPVSTSTNPDGTGEFVTWDTRIDYLNISALGKLRINAGLFSPYVLAGPNLNYELNKTNSLGTLNIVEEDFNKTRVGFKLGIGTEFNLILLKLLAEFLYNINFDHLYESENLQVSSNSFDLRIGILL